MFKYTKSPKPSKKGRSGDTCKETSLSATLEENVKIFSEVFVNDDMLAVRYFENQYDSGFKCCILFINGMINNDSINENIIRPIISGSSINKDSTGIDGIMNHVIISNSIRKTADIDELIEAILTGDTALLLEGMQDALIISTIGWQTRSISEPEGEKNIRGPREGFTESLNINLSMIRRKLLTPDLKFKFRSLGVRSHTKICICYIEGLASTRILSSLHKKLDSINIDGVLDTGYIQELIRDSTFSPFRTIGNTERPDIVAAKLLEGRIAVVMDGTPFVLTLPNVFIEYFQANEDYYDNYYFSSINRLIRILCFVISISLPAVFVALTAFHQEMVPTHLLVSISAARQGVPFPIIVETLALLVAFEILRETGTRMPSQVGQSLSIVGALVLGQAAVEARFISAPVVIIVAMTGITGLALPRLKESIIIIRLMLLLLASVLGLYGYIFGIIGLLIHLFELRSFGVPYMLSIVPSSYKDLQDVAIRIPWKYIKYRPKALVEHDRVRNNPGGKKNEED